MLKIIKKTKQMKKFRYYIAALLMSSMLLSCGEDTVDNGGDESEDYGELKASFQTMDIDGDLRTTFDIGEKIFFIDMSEGTPDSRLWNTTGASIESSDRRNFIARYGRDGAFDVGLAVKRSFDDELDSLVVSDYISINWIPVDAAFTTDVPTSRGKCYIKLGDYVTFVDQSEGMPLVWNWTFENGTPSVSNNATERVQFREIGTFDVAMYVNRDFGDGNPSDDTKSRSNFIIVEERVVSVASATYNAGLATLTFSDPLAITDADALKADITATAKNGANTYPLSVGTVSLKSDDVYTLELTIEGDIYQDDELILSMGTTTSLYDSTLLTAASPFNTPCDVVGFEEGNILDPDYVGYENGNGAINNAFTVDYYIGQTDVDNSYQRTTDKAYVGEASMRFMDEVKEGKSLYGMFFSDYTLEKSQCEFLPAGDYMLYQPIYIEEGSSIKTAKFIIADRLDWSPYVEHDWSMADLPRGRWVVMRTKINIEKDLGTIAGDRTAGTRSTYQVLSAGNEDVTGDQTFYLDGMSIVPLTNARPITE